MGKGFPAAHRLCVQHRVVRCFTAGPLTQPVYVSCQRTCIFGGMREPETNPPPPSPRLSFWLNTRTHYTHAPHARTRPDYIKCQQSASYCPGVSSPHLHAAHVCTYLGCACVPAPTSCTWCSCPTPLPFPAPTPTLLFSVVYPLVDIVGVRAFTPAVQVRLPQWKHSTTGTSATRSTTKTAWTWTVPSTPGGTRSRQRSGCSRQT